MYVCIGQCFFISSYGPPLVLRASYLALHSSLFGPDGAVILSLTALTFFFNWLKMYYQWHTN